MVVPVELKLRYLSRRTEDLTRLREALLDNDFSHALKVGHQVKGNAVTFEFPQMASIAIELESAAKKQDKDLILMLVGKLESAISAAQELTGTRATHVPLS